MTCYVAIFKQFLIFLKIRNSIGGTKKTNFIMQISSAIKENFQ